MAFTGKLGASNSTLGNIMLGVSSFTPVEPAEEFPILTLLTRDPETPPRMRRFVDLVSDVHNSLVRTGQLVQLGPAEWLIDVSGVAGVTSFNGRDGAVTFEEGDLPESGVTPGDYSVVSVDIYGRVVDGTLGNQFYADNGVPIEAVANVGDYYLDLLTGKLYLKS